MPTALNFDRNALTQYVERGQPILNGRAGGYTNKFDDAHYDTLDLALAAAFASIRALPNAVYGKSVAELKANA